MKKYIIHYPILTDRKEYIEEAINNSIVSDINFISKWNRNDGKNALYQNNIKYLPDEKIWKYKCKNYYKEIPPFRYITPGEVACALNHIFAWNEISNNGDGLILEDDVIFCDNFELIFNQILSEMPADLDVLFIGGGFYHDHVAKTISVYNNFYKKSHPSTNTVCAYMLKQNVAQRMCDAMKYHTLPIDFEMNYLFDYLNLNVYHHIPYIVKVGSNEGIYRSCNR